MNVVWDRSIDKDIGIVKKHLLTEPTLKGYNFPDPLEERLRRSPGMPENVKKGLITGVFMM